MFFEIIFKFLFGDFLTFQHLSFFEFFNPKSGCEDKGFNFISASIFEDLFSKTFLQNRNAKVYISTCYLLISRTPLFRKAGAK